MPLEPSEAVDVKAGQSYWIRTRSPVEIVSTTLHQVMTSVGWLLNQDLKFQCHTVGKKKSVLYLVKHACLSNTKTPSGCHLDLFMALGFSCSLPAHVTRSRSKSKSPLPSSPPHKRPSKSPKERSPSRSPSKSRSRSRSRSRSLSRSRSRSPPVRSEGRSELEAGL